MILLRLNVANIAGLEEVSIENGEKFTSYRHFCQPLVHSYAKEHI